MADGSTHPIPRRETSRDRAKAATAQKILQAARTLFEDVGFEAATIRDIAAKAAMSTGAVFANYEDKVDLYRTIYGHPPITPEVGRMMLAALDAAESELGHAFRGCALVQALATARDASRIAIAAARRTA